jgi:hypothetical protein
MRLLNSGCTFSKRFSEVGFIESVLLSVKRELSSGSQLFAGEKLWPPGGRFTKPKPARADYPRWLAHGKDYLQTRSGAVSSYVAVKLGLDSGAGRA